MSNKCAYCGTALPASAETCWRCGGPVAKDEPRWQRGEPYWFNGLFIWPETDYSRELIRLHFYEGPELLEVIELSRQVLREKFPANVCIDDGFIWDLFCVAHYGEKRVYVGSAWPDSAKLRVTVERIAAEGKDDGFLERICQ